MIDKTVGKTDIIDIQKTLILTVGLPYSGKSTWAKEQFFPVVNPDAIRVALHGERYKASMEPYVWAIAKTMVKSLFMAGHSTVILDATNTTEKRRKEWAGEWVTSCKVFFVGEAECVKRALDAEDVDIVLVIKRMADSFDPVEDTYSLLEGVHEVWKGV